MNEITHNIYDEKLYRIPYGFGAYDTCYLYERRKVGKIDLYLHSHSASSSTASSSGAA